jgi:branched-chain amino acid transport system permease protein
MTVNVAMSLAACLICVIAWLSMRSRYHFAFRAMRANEAASQMLGIYPLKFRTGIMALCGAMASLVGGIEAWHGGYLDPATAFDLHNTITSQIAPILGGIYTLGGPVIGAIATVALGDATRLALGHVEGASLLVFGLVLMACVLFLPDGIHGAVAKLTRRADRKPADVAAAVRP